MSIVPDSITPVEGWKSWDLVGGDLFSPSYQMLWPKEEPAKAECLHNMQFYYEWVVSKDRPPEPEEDITFTASITAFTHAVPPKPKTLLPRGRYWSLACRQVKHTPPGESCTCGIYIANSLIPTLGYGSILGKVQGWGQVVKHMRGWRTQYAYPSELYAADLEQALVLADYGVSVTVADDIADEKLREAVLAAKKKDGPTARALTRVEKLAPLPLAGLTIGQGALFLHDPSVIAGIATGVAAFGAVFVTSMNWWPRG